MTQYKKGPEFSEQRQTRVLLEDLRSQFRFFGEGQAIMQKDLNEVRGRVEQIEDKVERIESKVDHLETEMSFVRKVLPTVATKDDLRIFDRRLTALEQAG